jgi:hypothetical protein
MLATDITIRCTSYRRYTELNQRHRFVESNVSTTDVTKLKSVDHRRYVKWNMSTTRVT